ncbi:peptidylprolyl isomerase [Synechococcus sp. PCC 7336]|uniref:peptidylprolyl isomerase n=1 Tax=Synechococcus sp. PCC 7336 TaxID=195250 RepID=UPI0003474EA0|nr:peptidylprolyl isomerase [Synechococcus sp. PCC 7336]
MSVLRSLPCQIRQGFKLLCGAVLLFSFLTACGPPTSDVDLANEAIAAQYADRPHLEGTAEIDMVVDTAAAGRGTIAIVLNGDAAPLTAGNFIDLVERGFYHGLTFHRVVARPDPFVVQGGDPKGDGTGGFVDPETLRTRQIPLEISVKLSSKDGIPQYKTYYNKFFDRADISKLPALSHIRGAIAMARSRAPNSASSQFYFTLSDQPQLDGRYAVFGYVEEDSMAWVDRIQIGDTIVSTTATIEGKFTNGSQ